MIDRKGGGMGVRNLRLHNKSLLLKWLRKYNDGSDKTWKNLINAKYVRKGSRCPPVAQNSSRGSIWTNMSKLWNEFQQHTKLKLGYGAKIKFWSELWVGEESLKNRFPTLYNCSFNREGCVSEFYFPDGRQLNFRRDFNDWEVVEVGQLLQVLSTAVVVENKEDTMVWTASNDLKFSVKSCYSILQKQSEYCDPTGHGRCYGDPKHLARWLVLGEFS